ncbi:serotriflin [Larimichthys crocea]|uniref:serotriflin n=1 Tax=Larimichthys crocea TaxID=215358 RepID=UPI000F5F1E2D|nr:serotriflin [Larimichthys crocea]
MHTLSFLCVLGLAVALQVPCTSAWFGWSNKDRSGSSSSSSGGGSTEVTSSVKREIVDKHNALRRNVRPSASDMLKMSWDNEAAANALRWAKTCSMDHSSKSARKISGFGCGENLYMASYKNSWSNAIQSWYDEIEDWRYGVGSTNGGVVGHFTQVVWAKSYKIGCALAHCPNSRYKYFYVCQYCPPGNYQLARPYETGRPCGACPGKCENGLCTNPCPYVDKYGNCPDLKRKWTCSKSEVASWCPASCKCGS